MFPCLIISFPSLCPTNRLPHLLIRCLHFLWVRVCVYSTQWGHSYCWQWRSQWLPHATSRVATEWGLCCPRSFCVCLPHSYTLPSTPLSDPLIDCVCKWTWFPSWVLTHDKTDRHEFASNHGNKFGNSEVPKWIALKGFPWQCLCCNSFSLAGHWWRLRWRLQRLPLQLPPPRRWDCTAWVSW